MEELHEIATAYYQTAASEYKESGQKFFKAMDKDGDEQISLHEYLAFMKNEGHVNMANRILFRSLNKSGSGKLDLMEAMTLLYIIESGRTFCEGCGEFIAVMFFSCSECFYKEDKSFNICYECFKQKTYVHSHGKFLDNYILLENERLEAVKKKKAAKKRQKEEERKKREAEDVSKAVQPIPEHALAIVPFNPHQGDFLRQVVRAGAVCVADAAVTVVETAVSVVETAASVVGDAVDSAVSAISQCSIM